MLDHVHRERNDRNLPVGVGQQWQKRQHAMVERHLLADRRIELIVHQRPREVPGEIRIARQVRQRPFPPALIRLGVRRADAEGEGRVSVEEKLVHVVVVNDQEQIRPHLIQPLPGRNVTIEQRRPHRLLLLSAVPGHADRGRVGGADAADHCRHVQCAFRAWYSAKVIPAVWAPISGSGYADGGADLQQQVDAGAVFHHALPVAAGTRSISFGEQPMPRM